jgi:hypothetical protein
MSDFLKIAEDDAGDWENEPEIEIDQTIARLLLMINETRDPDVRDILDDAVCQLAGLLEIDSDDENDFDDRLDAA